MAARHLGVERRPELAPGALLQPEGEYLDDAADAVNLTMRDPQQVLHHAALVPARALELDDGRADAEDVTALPAWDDREELARGSEAEGMLATVANLRLKPLRILLSP